MKRGKYQPKTSVPTLSNAMDVGDPSNFVRIRHLYSDNFDHLQQHLTSYSFTDEQTKEAVRFLFENSGYIADPHGAVGYLGLKQYQESNPESYGIFLETAHPVKFLDMVETTLQTKIDIPPQIKRVMGKSKSSIQISTYDELKQYLLRNR